ncbi:hypothetical protein BP6252_01910 [Coleophoma cylindrospora]|uniref:Uncharacterized protein n=1 Tax=Coleophoma cylindrospora TaxID=1849047 RepID=A0A3D8SDA8_9HELO|nr:hypothetical protein BP6252_01910 [Coleophoma cylindrospora]
MSRANWRPNNYQEIETKQPYAQQYPFDPSLRDGMDEDDTLWKRTVRHVKRHWIIYSVLNVVGLALSLVITFLVVIPAIVQKVVDGNQLPVISASLLNPSPNSVQMSLVSTIDTPSAITTNLKPLNLSLAGPDNKTPFLAILLPEKDLKGKTTIEVQGQTAAITNMESFESFLAVAMYNKNFTMQATGTTDAFLGAIRAPVTLNKQIEMAGLNNLTGFNLGSPQLLTTAEADGTNLLATANIPNPSVLTIGIGNLTMNLAIGNVSIGNASIDNVVLQPGNNPLPLRATISLAAIAANIQQISKEQPALATNGILAINATGNTTTFNGERLMYFERVLNPVVLTTTVPVQQLLGGGGSTSTTASTSNTGNGTRSGNSTSPATGSSSRNGTSSAGGNSSKNGTSSAGGKKNGTSTTNREIAMLLARYIAEEKAPAHAGKKRAELWGW